MSSARKVLAFVLPYWRPTLLVSIAGLFFSFVNLLRPYLVGLFANLLTQSGSLPPILQGLAPSLRALGLPERNAAIAVVCLVFFGVNLLAPLEDIFVHLPKRLVALRIANRLHRQAYQRVLSLPLSYFETNNSGLLVSRLERAISKLQLLYVSVVHGGIMVFSTLTVATFLFFSIDPALGWVFASTISICVVIICTMFSHLQPYVDLGERILDRTMSRLSEIVLNIKTVKAFVQEAREYRRGLRWLNRFERFMARKTYGRFFVADTAMWLLLNLSFSAIVGLSAYLAATNKIDVGGMITAITIAQIARADVSGLREPTELFTTSASAIAWLYEFLHLPLQEPRSGEQAIGSLGPAKLSFRGVQFSYRANLPPVLCNLNLEISPYTTVALVGPSGSGKSTLTKLLYRFVDPTQGQILWDGLDIREFKLSEYRSQLAIVPQEVEVFNGTVLSNILYGRPDLPTEKAIAAAKLARAHEFILDLPEGYDSVVGERGIRLSGGQRQRLGIARAILMRPAVLILDEATSNLDSESEHLIQQALQDLFGTCTVIVIAHRLSTVREADVIVVLESGRIVEQGTHQQLVSAGSGLYQRLHQLQVSGELREV
ncbi:ABC transporter ATP-binding protein [Leptolyngbya sp. FACHB-261]|uniref:ABC transporter ATP-binding protein n=1 Tax=Leptolyngbya sp. FACHB-261 TaxID=2692806 RepID=UPI0016884215|nr:ABC transporter ATP-binding protein [Leptolyngbya sp. FACHB-261]MBD2102895.1 ABC transporter ATP-binding protein [Leptolyngbya sp. FACHB-261]